jgi:Xaa-Pro dipeptidase
LTGVVEPDCWATIELPSGRSTLFVPRLDDEYAVWMGELKAPAEFGARYLFDDARFVDELQLCVKAALLEAGDNPQIADASYHF